MWANDVILKTDTSIFPFPSFFFFFVCQLHGYAANINYLNLSNVGTPEAKICEDWFDIGGGLKLCPIA